MIRLKKKLICVAAMLLAVVPCVSVAACGNGTAESNRKEQASYVNEPSGPLGLYTDLQFSLDGENGKVTASVNNKFTLFPSTVTVNIELYRSDVYREDFTFMSLAASNGVHDLDQGETVSASASTEGKGSYWKARAYYRVDNKPRQEKISETIYCSADGTKAPATKPETEEFYISDVLKTDAQVLQGVIGHTEYFNNTRVRIVDIFNFDKNYLAAVKNALDTFKFNPYFRDTLESKYYFLRGTFESELSLTIKYSEEEFILISFNDISKNDIGVNLYVSYIKNGGEKNFVSLIDNDTKEYLIDLAANIYESQKES